MLGWNISVHRVVDGAHPAHAESPLAARVAVWQAGLWGLRWLEQLVKDGKAVGLGGDGYPFRFTAPAMYLLPVIAAGPPGEQPTWVSGLHDILLPGWLGKTTIDRDVMDACAPDEWLLVVAWDES